MKRLIYLFAALILPFATMAVYIHVSRSSGTKTEAVPDVVFLLLSLLIGAFFIQALSQRIIQKTVCLLAYTAIMIPALFLFGATYVCAYFKTCL